ncbi:MAG: ribokinase [Clostridiales bacterium]|nr:ribokinase [Clostridiales bacterium]
MKQPFDIIVIGPLSLDRNIDHSGEERREIGGAVVASGFAAANTGSKTAIFTKFNPDEVDGLSVFKDLDAEVFTAVCKNTTSIQNRYLTADKERRVCTSLGRCDPFLESDLPDVQADIWHFAGLTYGDFSGELFQAASAKGKVAVDVQCLLRHILPDGRMDFFDWDKKEQFLPIIDYLKTDAAEAEILTGLSDRREAAHQLHAWGAKEIMITHNTEALIYDGDAFYTCPLIPRNLSGRTGRGDTCFAGYITKRRTQGIAESLTFASALVSLKMESPGPFRGSSDDVLRYIEDARLERGFNGTVTQKDDAK